MSLRMTTAAKVVLAPQGRRSLNMTIATEGFYEGDGLLKLDKPVNLAAHVRVRVTIETAADTAGDDDPLGEKAAADFVGFIKNAPEGVALARDHDQYLAK